MIMPKVFAENTKVCYSLEEVLSTAEIGADTVRTNFTANGLFALGVLPVTGVWSRQFAQPEPGYGRCHSRLGGCH